MRRLPQPRAMSGPTGTIQSWALAPVALSVATAAFAASRLELRRNALGQPARKRRAGGVCARRLQRRQRGQNHRLVGRGVAASLSSAAMSGGLIGARIGQRDVQQRCRSGPPAGCGSRRSRWRDRPPAPAAPGRAGRRDTSPRAAERVGLLQAANLQLRRQHEAAPGAGQREERREEDQRAVVHGLASAGLISAVASAQADDRARAVEPAHQPAQVHQEHEVAERHQQVAHRARPQEGQGALAQYR